MTSFTLATRSAGRNKVRTALAVAGLAIIGALNFDMLLLSRGLLLSFADLINSGGFDVRITSGEGTPAARSAVTGASELRARIQQVPQVDRVAAMRIDEAFATAAGAPEERVALVGTSEKAGGAGWTLMQGNDLTASSDLPAIVVTKQFADKFRIGPGGTIQLRPGRSRERSVLPSVECRIAGIAEFSFEAAGDYTVLTSLESLQAIHGGRSEDEADLILVASRTPGDSDDVVAAIRKLRSDLDVYSNDALVEQFSRNNFAYFRQLSLVLSTTTALFTLLLVATLLTVSVNQRLGEIAAFRAIGISQRRVAAMLLWESALLVGTGGTIALPLGGALAVFLDRILRGIPGLPERLHFFVFEPRAFVLHSLLLLVTTVVAATYPMWLAVTLPISSTLRREVVS